MTIHTKNEIPRSIEQEFRFRINTQNIMDFIFQITDVSFWEFAH